MFFFLPPDWLLIRSDIFVSKVEASWHLNVKCQKRSGQITAAWEYKFHLFITVSLPCRIFLLFNFNFWTNKQKYVLYHAACGRIWNGSQPLPYNIDDFRLRIMAFSHCMSNRDPFWINRAFHFHSVLITSVNEYQKGVKTHRLCDVILNGV